MDSEHLSKFLVQALKASRFLGQELASRPWLPELLAKTIDEPITAEAMRDFLAREAPDEAHLKRGLRHLRTWVLCHTVSRDLSGIVQLGDVMETMTLLAEISVEYARDVLSEMLAERYGRPREANGRVMDLIIVGMGKVGGRELNVSSDIDLIFLYPADGETDGERSLTHFDFFTRLGRLLIGALNEVTADGFVFRVDMRLRPYGESGPLVLSYEAFEHYLIAQGREWERFAWIKARPLCGDREEELAAIVRPFIFRKYFDFGAINALRSFHAQIRKQVASREMADNIKLGPGGIREIEFIAQVFQIIRGGRNKALQIKPTLQVLDKLAERGHLDLKTAEELKSAYVFLRCLEHRLQYLDDAQTHTLPASPEDMQLVTEAMGFAGQEMMLRILNIHRAAVNAAFQVVCGDPCASDPARVEMWDGAATPGIVQEQLAKLGFNDPATASQHLLQLHQGSCYRHLEANIRERFDSLIPRIIEDCAVQPNPDVVLVRLLNLLETISRRGAYLALLQQYPQALRRLIELVSASSWASNYLTTHPILLDDLLDGRNLDDVTNWPIFIKQLQERLDAFDPDTERQMDLMRDMHHSQVFRIYHQDIAGKWSVEQIGDHLSALADIMLDETIRQCWRKYKNRHCTSPNFAVIGYGKLGGKELGYASDLDIVFLYDDDDQTAQEHYVRLAQRILTWMSTRTSSGVLFETDTRLRPSGKSGLLVSQLDAFFKYQKESAWLWEHQALTRARFVAGNRAVGEAFEAGRKQVLMQPRQRERLREEILEMRRKLLSIHPGRDGYFNVKDDRGGLVDFEFIIQYLILGNAHVYPRLVENLGNIALSRIAGELGLLDVDRAKKAANAYRILRRMQHRLRLNGEGNWVEKHIGSDERKAISALWLEVFNDQSSNH
jgi:[glutamine synthetase] adenylyltransferase / [glutamine synthetase]-adenylyl-L-tyrosine phosphorylase